LQGNLLVFGGATHFAVVAGLRVGERAHLRNRKQVRASHDREHARGTTLHTQPPIALNAIGRLVPHS
jgi:hypothetical protein